MLQLIQMILLLLQLFTLIHLPCSSCVALLSLLHFTVATASVDSCWVSVVGFICCRSRDQTLPVHFFFFFYTLTQEKPLPFTRYITRYHQIYKEAFVCLCRSNTLTFLHALPSDFICNLIQTQGRFFLHASWPRLPFLIHAILLELKSRNTFTLPVSLVWLHRFSMPPFYCSNSK